MFGQVLIIQPLTKEPTSIACEAYIQPVTRLLRVPTYIECGELLTSLRRQLEIGQLSKLGLSWGWILGRRGVQHPQCNGLNHLPYGPWEGTNTRRGNSSGRCTTVNGVNLLPAWASNPEGHGYLNPASFYILFLYPQQLHVSLLADYI